ncbi:hypothetical protein CALVIDRAFT_307338 [Calocera viscosa TUFC12733]|uniref:Uncharacterized protein n=1 Tax=Calocera viscosa (strain TUFC12733) TaxID=1330018 RepID=A0A167IBQ7_CALVF|nr:hypothetical protein CALVIDRAFT_307338 [Calocera viscosa TUFC12733]
MADGRHGIEGRVSRSLPIALFLEVCARCELATHRSFTSTAPTRPPAALDAPIRKTRKPTARGKQGDTLRYGKRGNHPHEARYGDIGSSSVIYGGERKPMERNGLGDGHVRRTARDVREPDRIVGEVGSSIKAMYGAQRRRGVGEVQGETGRC